jgi:DNA-binding transcriptional ArsR family regulator
MPKNLRSRSAAYIFVQPIGCAFEKQPDGRPMRRDVFQAIADPTRRAIITLIAVQAMTPNAIAERFDITRQSVSKHIRILTECDLLKKSHEGREIYYQLHIEKMKEIDLWIEPFRKQWEQSFKQLDQLLKDL